MRVYGNKVWEENNKKGEGITITMNDDSVESQKIREGYDFDIVNSKIVIKNKINFDLKSFKLKLTAGTATLADIREFLIKYLIK